MKRCLECGASFPDADQFCEHDGATLVADDADSDPALSAPPVDLKSESDSLAPVVGVDAMQVPRYRSLPPDWKILTIVAVAGATVVAVLFVVYLQKTREIPQQSANERSSDVAVQQQQAPRLSSLPSPSVDATPSPESSPSPSASPSPSVLGESARVTLSSSPVSTGGDANTSRGQVTIRLTNGTAIEADEAWETREGIWYRRRGVVSLLDRDQVKAIERTAENKLPASATPASPESSPKASP
jgi:hypothetical protein